ncbi:hypothetical protein ACQPZ8_21070 [Actinomadura nitritigenes]|uniref:hypothetical protein n=1 Tax=Actinomadura nitritigenes TaxID=134602 RepID=UPI003D8C2197
MTLDVQLDGRPDAAAERARALIAAGVDGLFTFEGPHDVFLPLIVAAGSSDVPPTDQYPQAIVAMGDTPEEIEAASLGVKALPAFYGSTPAYRPVLDVEGWGSCSPS